METFDFAHATTQTNTINTLMARCVYGSALIESIYVFSKKPFKHNGETSPPCFLKDSEPARYVAEAYGIFCISVGQWGLPENDFPEIDLPVTFHCLN